MKTKLGLGLMMIAGIAMMSTAAHATTAYSYRFAQCIPNTGNKVLVNNDPTDCHDVLNAPSVDWQTQAETACSGIGETLAVIKMYHACGGNVGVNDAMADWTDGTYECCVAMKKSLPNVSVTPLN